MHDEWYLMRLNLLPKNLIKPQTHYVTPFKILNIFAFSDQIFFLPPTRSNLDNPLKLCTFAIDKVFYGQKYKT